jgi:hypothetical protein
MQSIRSGVILEFSFGTPGILYRTRVARKPIARIFFTRSARGLEALSTNLSVP